DTELDVGQMVDGLAEEAYGAVPEGEVGPAGVVGLESVAHLPVPEIRLGIRLTGIRGYVPRHDRVVDGRQWPVHHGAAVHGRPAPAVPTERGTREQVGIAFVGQRFADQE